MVRFSCLDKPLTDKQMAELRGVTSRAEITPTRLWCSYDYSSMRGDPAKLDARYFDAHLYAAAWGENRLILKMAKSRVDVKALKPYFLDRPNAYLRVVGAHVILDLTSHTEDRDGGEDWNGFLYQLAPLRAEVMSGDLRVAYLAWLAAALADDLDDDDEEPPVPANLDKLTPAQKAMAAFLRIDADVLAAAAAASPKATSDDAAFARWVKALPQKEKDRWLVQAAEDPSLPLGSEMLRTFRGQQRQPQGPARRTVGELLARADEKARRREKARRTRQKSK